jgi:hypothetical protein
MTHTPYPVPIAVRYPLMVRGVFVCAGRVTSRAVALPPTRCRAGPDAP